MFCFINFLLTFADIGWYLSCLGLFFPALTSSRTGTAHEMVLDTRHQVTLLTWQEFHLSASAIKKPAPFTIAFNTLMGRGYILCSNMSKNDPAHTK